MAATGLALSVLQICSSRADGRSLTISAPKARHLLESDAILRLVMPLVLVVFWSLMIIWVWAER